MFFSHLLQDDLKPTPTCNAISLSIMFFRNPFRFKVEQVNTVRNRETERDLRERLGSGRIRPEKVNIP